MSAMGKYKHLTVVAKSFPFFSWDAGFDRAWFRGQVLFGGMACHGVEFAIII